MKEGDDWGGVASAILRNTGTTMSSLTKLRLQHVETPPEETSLEGSRVPRG